MNQIINGVEVIKMYVWEVPYSLLVEKARRKEVDVIKKYSIVEQIGLTLDMYFPYILRLHTSIYYIARSLEFSDDVRANDLFMILPSVDSSFCVF